MSCKQTGEFLDAYVDRELDPVAAFEFERHLAECVSCRESFEQYRQLHDSVRRQLPRFHAPEELERRLRAQIRVADHETIQPAHTTTPSRWRTWAVLAAAAILLIFGAFLFQVAQRPRTPQLLAGEVVASHIRSLLANHLVDVPSSDQHTVKPWFIGKIDFAPVVKDLSADGFPLIGGRLDYFDNQTVVALVYKRRQHVINLFLWPASDSDSKPRSMVLRGYNILYGTQSHMTYWAVSDLNAAELNDFLRAFEK
jgi:anti-sigma factor RsiW